MDKAALNEVLDIVCGFDETTAQAITATSQARMFLITKLAESKKLGEECQEKVQTKLKELQEEIAPHIQTLKDIKDKPREFGHAALLPLRDAMDRVRKAEATVETAAEEAAIFTGPDAEKMTADEMYIAKQKHTAVDRTASAALVEARKFVLTKQMEENKRTGSG